MPDRAIIMGVDAALAATGIGIIGADGDSLELIHTELIRTKERDQLPQRLEKIYQATCKAIEKYRPQMIALEDIFYSKNLRIALNLGQARGAIMLACAKYKLRLAEYSAREIKQAVTGNGAASKEQVSFMVKSLLKIKDDFQTMDISDSLAAAICASFRLKEIMA